MRLEHRVTTPASPAEVWALLGDLAAWPAFELFLRSVRGAHGPAAVGQRLMGRVRLSTVSIPIDVLEVVPEERLVVLVHTAPGLRERLAFDLTPSLRRGTDVRLSLSVEGLLALPAVLPLWLAGGLTARVLAAVADAQARKVRRAA